MKCRMKHLPCLFLFHACLCLRAGSITSCSIAVGTQTSTSSSSPCNLNNLGTPGSPSAAFVIASASSSMLIAEAGIGAIPPPLQFVSAGADANYQGFLYTSGGPGTGFVNVFFSTGLLVVACCDPLTGVQTH